MVDKNKFLMTDASSDTIKQFWHDYHAYRYDFNFTFPRFLSENGIYAQVASPNLGPFGYDLDDVEIVLN